MTSLVDQNVLSRERVLAGQLEACHVQYVPHHPAFDVDVQLGVGVEAAGHVRREGGNEHTLSHKGLCVYAHAQDFHTSYLGKSIRANQSKKAT